MYTSHVTLTLVFVLVRSELGIYIYLYGKPLVVLDNLKRPQYSDFNIYVHIYILIYICTYTHTYIVRVHIYILI
jgi:hypothetical protein